MWTCTASGVCAAAPEQGSHTDVPKLPAANGRTQSLARLGSSSHRKLLQNRVLYCTVLYCTVLYCTVLYCTVLYCTVLILYCTVLHCTVLFFVLYCTVLVLVLYCTVVLYNTVLYCTCTVLEYMQAYDITNQSFRGWDTRMTLFYCTVLCSCTFVSGSQTCQGAITVL